ncbi:DinB family protein [Flagellimonas meridianipacifica]|uniref:Putative damage-inducible protein DinB n=1 Tax=Flagellimonas meridianipacifica TaxID=1080225 RepID=A0A2T0M950_9FLAO|nr:DinB family protein [Allomuricauda pacifica]PRX53998.1 putative damage-inducible protein DinB [Allomuricauda pacifica]
MRLSKQLSALLTLLFTSWMPMNAQKSSFKTEFLKKWENSLEYTLEVAKEMPEEHFNFKPAEGVRSFGEQLVHIGEGIAYIGNSALKFQTFPQPGNTNDKEAIVSYLKLQYSALQEAVKSKEASYFEETTSFWAGRMTRRKILNIVFDHCTHHRAQAIVHLRINGKRPPDYMGW